MPASSGVERRRSWAGSSSAHSLWGLLGPHGAAEQPEGLWDSLSHGKHLPNNFERAYYPAVTKLSLYTLEEVNKAESEGSS